MKKKKKKIETVRLITFDQAVIDVVGGTVLRREILENFIVANNEMMTVVGGNSLLRLGKNLAAGSYVLRINRESSLWQSEAVYSRNIDDCFDYFAYYQYLLSDGNVHTGKTGRSVTARVTGTYTEERRRAGRKFFRRFFYRSRCWNIGIA